MKHRPHPMRKVTREVTSFARMIEILDACDVIRLGMYDHEYHAPYIVPLNFAYRADLENEELVIYFHCAQEGRKIELLAEDPIVAIEADCDHEFHMHDDAASATMYFKSIMGEGVAMPVETNEERKLALDLLMQRFGSPEPHPAYRQGVLDITRVYRVDVTTLSGKVNPGENVYVPKDREGETTHD